MYQCERCGSTVAHVNEAEFCTLCANINFDIEEVVSKRSNTDDIALKRAAKSRKAAKLLGAKALKGSAKQKAWGEQLRSKFLAFAENEKALEMVISSAITQTAKFWIETRDVENNDLEVAFINLVEATAKANEIGAGNEGYDDQLIIRSEALKTLKL